MCLSLTVQDKLGRVRTGISRFATEECALLQLTTFTAGHVSCENKSSRTVQCCLAFPHTKERQRYTRHRELDDYPGLQGRVTLNVSLYHHYLQMVSQDATTVPPAPSTLLPLSLYKTVL